MKLESKYIIWPSVIYYSGGAIIAFFILVSTIGLPTLLYHFVPFLITVIVFSFYVFSGAFFLKHPNYSFAKDVFLIAIFFQTIKLEIAGFSFKNTFGPYIDLIVQNDGGIEILLRANYMSIFILNGSGDSYTSNYFSVNLINIFTMVIIDYYFKKSICNE